MNGSGELLAGRALGGRREARHLVISQRSQAPPLPRASPLPAKTPQLLAQPLITITSHSSRPSAQLGYPLLPLLARCHFQQRVYALSHTPLTRFIVPPHSLLLFVSLRLLRSNDTAPQNVNNQAIQIFVRYVSRQTKLNKVRHG